MATALWTQNAAYTATQTIREKARDLYEGADVVKGKGQTYLFKGKNEDDIATNSPYQIRLKRARYENLIRKIITWRQAIMFQKGHSRKVASRLAGLEANADRRNTSAATFFADVARDAQVDGVCFVGVDMPRAAEGQYASAAEEERAGFRPFFEKIPASSVIDWAYDDSMILLWAMICQAAPDRRTGPEDTVKAATQYKLWTRTDWVLYEVGAGNSDTAKTEIGRGTNRTGQVPIIPFYGERYVDMAGWPVCRAVLDDCILLYNKQSDLDYFEMLASNPIPVVIAPTKPELLEVGKGLYIKSSPDCGQIEAKYLEITGAGFDSIRQSIADIRAQIYGIMLGQGRKDTAQVESMDAQREYKRILTASLAESLTSYERSETECWRIAEKWVNESTQSEITYNKDLDSTLIDTAVIDTMTAMADAGRLTTRTLLKAAQEGEMLPSDFDLELELEELSKQEATRSAETLAVMKAGNEPGEADEQP
jgi:hypothetical protein